MSHTPHELQDDFPDLAEKIHELKLENPHFARLVEDYHEINRAVHRAESDVEPTDDLHLVEMRKERLRLKDEIYAMLTNPQPTS